VTYSFYVTMYDVTLVKVGYSRSSAFKLIKDKDKISKSYREPKVHHTHKMDFINPRMSPHIAKQCTIFRPLGYHINIIFPLDNSKERHYILVMQIVPRLNLSQQSLRGHNFNIEPRNGNV